MARKRGRSRAGARATIAPWAKRMARPPDAHGRPSRFRRIARLLGWNALILLVLLVLAAGGAEVYLRLTGPAPAFRGENVLPVRVVPGVGVIRPPHAEIRYTNGRDFWQVSRTNSLGFPDREPPSPERVAESCHVTLIGDSFVEALEVPIADKAQVRLEELAAREAPELDVTTSAFGHRDTAQINQLAFYDAFARRLLPDVVVLVAVTNDFEGNSLALKSWTQGFHPDHPPWLFARPGAHGEMEFVPPAASLEELRANLLSRLLAEPRRSFLAEQEWRWRATGPEVALRTRSYLADWSWRTLGGVMQSRELPQLLLARAAWLSRHPRHATFLEGWSGTRSRGDLLLAENPPPVFREALDVMRFALEQFRERAERDGAALIILTQHGLGGAGNPWFERLRELAAGSGGEIPVISQYDHIVAAGGEVADARWANDGHWSATGHRWAAEAILQWLKANPEACD